MSEWVADTKPIFSIAFDRKDKKKKKKLEGSTSFGSRGSSCFGGSR